MSSGNSIPLNYIVFDDEVDEINQNHRNVVIPGITCNLIYFNPNDFFDAASDTFDLERFKAKIIDDTKGLQIALVATDWNMQKPSSNYDEINGLKIVEILIEINEKYRKIPFLIYSGKVGDASKVIITRIQEEISAHNDVPISSLELLSLLLELKVKFCGRNTRFEEIKALIRGEKSISLIVTNILANAEKNLVIGMGNEFYDGKTVGSLVELVDKNEDAGLKFVREFIELAIANYTELNAN